MKNLFDVMAESVCELQVDTSLVARRRHDLFGAVGPDNSTWHVPLEHTEIREDGIRIYSTAAEDYANMLASFVSVKGGDA